MISAAPATALDDPVAYANALRRLELTRQRLQAIKDNGIENYTPHPKQEAFHRAAKYVRRAYFAGNRSGKSECAAAELVALAMGYRPWWKEGDPGRTVGIPKRPLKILVVTTDWNKVDEIFTGTDGANPGKLWRLFPKGFVDRTYVNHSSIIDTIVCKNGSMLKFYTEQAFKKNPQSAESADWDHIHYDEPCPKELHSATSRGLVDRGGTESFTLTPLRQPWIWDMFYGEDADVQQAAARGMINLHKDIYWSVTGSIWDNPYLSEEAIRLFLEEQDPDEREAREHGIPLQFSGLIYKEFQSAVHVMQRVPEGWEDFDTPCKSLTCYTYCDPHPNTPTAILQVYVDDFGRKYIARESFLRDLVPAQADFIKEGEDGHIVGIRRGDPCMFNIDKLTGSCWASDFEDCGVDFERAVKDLERGIIATKKALKSRFVDGTPEWMVSPYCKRFIYEIKRWHWDKENKPVDKEDHMMENFYRAVLDNPVHIAPSGDHNREIRDVALPSNPLELEDLRMDLSLD